jgi:hypothetical protein
MRALMGFAIVVLVAAAFVLAYLAEHAVSSVDLPPPDDRQQEYLEENRRLIGELVEACKRHAPEEEMERIRQKRREVNRRHFEYNVRNH